MGRPGGCGAAFLDFCAASLLPLSLQVLLGLCITLIIQCSLSESLFPMNTNIDISVVVVIEICYAGQFV